MGTLWEPSAANQAASLGYPIASWTATSCRHDWDYTRRCLRIYGVFARFVAGYGINLQLGAYWASTGWLLHRWCKLFAPPMSTGRALNGVCAPSAHPQLAQTLLRTECKLSVSMGLSGCSSLAAAVMGVGFSRDLSTRPQRVTKTTAS